MDVAGQGKIDDGIKRRVSEDNKNKEHVIDFRPRFTWNLKTLPTKVPDVGSKGGAVYVNYDSERLKKLISDGKIDNTDLHQTIFINDVGYGAGGIMPPAAGPVMIGIASFGSPDETALWIIAIILIIICAIIWAILHLIFSSDSSDSCLFIKSKKRQKNSIKSKELWLENFAEKNKSRSSVDQLPFIQISSDLSKNQITWSQNQQYLSMGKMNQEYPPSVHLSTLGSIKHVGVFSPSSISSKSFQTSLADNVSSIYGSLSSGFTYSQIVESQSLGLVFTISDKKCPNTWLKKECKEVSHCQTSNFEECLEVFLLNQETLLVGKMKNLRFRGSQEDFVIQIWRTSDGTLGSSTPYEWSDPNVSCDAICTVLDEFLVFIQKEKIVVWNTTTNRIVSISALQNLETSKKKHSIQVSRDFTNIIIITVLPLTGFSYIYVYKFDQLLRQSPPLQYRSFSSQKSFYSLISDTSILIAGSISGEIIIWNFSNNSEIIHNKNGGEAVQKVLNSPTKDLFLLHFTHEISIWSAVQMIQLSNISIPSSKVCSMTFSPNFGSGCLFASALEDGFIYLYNAYNGILIMTFQTNVPIVNMLFLNDNSSLVAMADRASHYELFIFTIQ